ncbi:MAG: STAS domain-containing protein [Candidatus Aminicenantes bacterium]|nr:STAS domain-containing protein [Candidatus Aminicenantes bacterium]NIM78245.1 STAS domain-containing protein [Candidatus Aminicenantes bacterium]NIN23751.1 STAS domain-containing protein [Candidatus Aminicenantes bacterium]NIN47458.1 STAS domain-containing protein [Candidatus Aminicenantes bacterium]NIN90386.1 STAS domain-containing protein [Candidatus Aminicenantes bacterium]
MVVQKKETLLEEAAGNVVEFLKKNESEILNTWIANQLKSVTRRPDLISKEELEAQSTKFLENFMKAISMGNLEDTAAKEFEPINTLLAEISKDYAVRGFTPSEAAIYIFSLKETLMEFFQKEYTSDPESFIRIVIHISRLLDKLGLVTFENFLEGREGKLKEYAKLMSEVSTPILFLWKEILFLPIVGVVDSKRAQTIMETILQQIVEKSSKIIILDILGVRVVDSAVANHIVKITRATRLMGCESIITGISSSIAQTLVNLGVDLGGLITKSTLIGGLEYAFDMLGYRMIQDSPVTKK